MVREPWGGGGAPNCLRTRASSCSRFFCRVIELVQLFCSLISSSSFRRYSRWVSWGGQAQAGQKSPTQLGREVGHRCPQGTSGGSEQERRRSSPRSRPGDGLLLKARKPSPPPCPRKQITFWKHFLVEAHLLVVPIPLCPTLSLDYRPKGLPSRPVRLPEATLVLSDPPVYPAC